MAYSTIILDKSEGIATVTLNRPENLNTLTETMAIELLDVFSLVAKDETVKVFIVTATGRAFCAGADIKGIFLKKIEERKLGEKGYDIAGWLTKACLRLREIPQPTIAAINGAAVGLGITIPLQCDMRIAAEEATISFPFHRIGVTPEFGSTFLLPRMIGIARACELIFTGKTISANTAKEIGLVNDVVPLSELSNVVRKLANTFVETAPIALRMAKKALYQGLESDLRKQLQLEQMTIESVCLTQDHEEGVKAFLEKRQPVFRGK